MNRLPNFVPPMEDELLYSYLMRLATANGFDDYLTFHKCFLHSRKYVPASITSAYALRYESNINLDPFYGIMENSITDFNGVDFLKKHTLYGCLSPLMNDYQQISYINWIFDGAGNHDSFSPPPIPMIRQLFFCPQCKKEEEEIYGFFWIHRIHQILGIKVCPKHRRPLIQFKCKKGHEFSDTDNGQQVEVDNIESEIRYASFIEVFVKENINANLHDIKYAISKRKKNYQKIFGEDFREKLFDEVLSLGKAHKINDDVLKKMFSTEAKVDKKRSGKEVFLIMLFCLFYHPLEISSYLPNDDNEKAFFELLKREEYTLLSPYRKDIIKIRHNKCNNIMYTTPDALLRGWFCPQCDANTNDSVFLKRMITMMTDGEYELIEANGGMNDDIKVLHKACGKVTSIRANSFIQLGSRCDCSRRVTYEKVKERVEANPHFKLVNFIDASKPVKILHLDCNNIFNRFYKDPEVHVCPHCKRRAEHNAGYLIDPEDFKERVEDLVGSEYTLIDEYKGVKNKIRIRHNICGNTKSYYPSHFIIGFRCPLCTPPNTREYVDAAVRHISGGRYSVKPTERKKYYEVFDNNKSIGVMFDNLILQELNRPTPSDILPLKHRFPYEYYSSLTDKEKILTWIKENRNNKKWFTAQEISETSNIPIKKVYSSLNALKGDILYKINKYYDLYVFAEHDIKGIIKELFISDSTGVYGVVVGEEFLYSLGFLNYPPRIIDIVTNRLDQSTLNIDDDDKQYRIKRSKIIITDQTKNIIPLLYLLNHSGITINKKMKGCIKKYCKEKNITEDVLEQYKSHKKAVARIKEILNL